MTEKKFVKGLKITKKESKYGNFLKCGIKVNTLTQENYITDEGWLNFAIFENQEGIPYAVMDEYKKPAENTENTENIIEDTDGEIPF